MSPIEEIKARLDLVEFISNYIRLQKAGINYKAACPFHSEKTPSFFVSPSRQIWHCFGGCGKGGDIFKFAMEIEGLDFPEALQLLAGRAGVVLRREDPALRSERVRLYDINEAAAGIFEAALASSSGVRAYLQGRGLEEKTVRDFRIGFAPQSWDYLFSRLRAKGYSGAEIEKAGLAVGRGSNTDRGRNDAYQTGENPHPSESSPRSPAFHQRESSPGGWYDRFRSRIMFPIADVNGRVIGFGGRIFSAEGGPASGGEKTEKVEAKYVNTPQTPLYDKSQVLFGFDKAKQEIRRQDRVVVVEGYMDCIMSHQSGVKNTVAVSGTALTAPQLKILRRLASSMAISFDTDDAGDTATRRSLALAAGFEFDRRIVRIPSGKDPADAVEENASAWRAAVEAAEPVLDFYFSKTFRSHDPRSAEGKKQIAAILLPLIGELVDKIEQAHWIAELARHLVVSEDAICQELGRRTFISAASAQTPSRSLAAPAAPPPLTRRDLLEERFLALLILQRSSAPPPVYALHLSFREPLHRRVFEWLSAAPPSDEAAPKDIAEALQLISFKSEALADMLKDVAQEFALCCREFERECIRDRLMLLGEELARKEREGNLLAVSELLHDARVLSDRIRELQ